MNSKTGISIRSYVPQLHGLPESLTDLKTISEELDMRFGQITLLQIPSSEAIIFYKQTEASQLEVHNKDLLQAKERLKLNDPHIIAMLDFTAGKLKKGGKTSYYVRGYYEYPNGDLLKEITHRRSIKRPFSLSDLVGLLSDLSAAGALLQRQRMVHGDIRPKYVTYNATLKKFQLMDRLGDPAPPLQAQLHNYLSATDLYMSPVIFHNFTQNISKFKHNPYKSEAFSVAMVVLETGLMTGLRHLYDEAGFCEAGLKECIRKLESQVGGQGRGFIDALRKITIIDESHRMDLLELHDYMRRTKVMTMLQRRPSQESFTQINVSKSAKSNNFASAAHSKTGEPINNRSGLHGTETSGMKSPQGNIQSLRFSEKTDVFHSPPQNFDLEMPVPQVLVSKKIANTRMPLRADEEFEQPARNGSIIPSRGSQSQYRQAQEDDQIPFCGQVHRVSAQNGCSTQNQDASQNQYTHQYNLHQGQGQDYSQLLDTPQFEVLEARQTSQDSRLPNNQYHVNNNYNGVNGQIKRETNNGDVYGQIRNTSDDEKMRHQNTNYMQNPTEANHLSSIQAGQPSFNTSFQLNNVREDQIEGGPTGQEMGAKFSRRDIDQQEYPIDGYNYHDVRNDDGQNMNNNIGNDEVNSENFNGVGNDHQQEEEEPAFHGKVFRMGIESGCGSGDANPQHSKDTVSSPGILPSNHQNQFSGYDSFNQSPNQNNGQYDHSNNDQGDYNIEYQESPQVSYQPKNIQKAQKTIENPTNPKEYKNDQNDNQKKSSNSRHSRQNSSEGQKHPRVPLDSEGKGETISKEVISRSNSINNPGGHTSKRSLDGGILKNSTQFAGTTGSVSVQNFDESPSNNLPASREPSIKNVRIREDPGLVKKSIPTAEDKEVEEVEFVSAKYDPAKRPSSRSGSRKGKGKEQNEGDHQSEGKASPLIASKGSKGNGQGGLQGAENGEDFADDLSRLAVRSRPNLKAVSTTTHEANPTISQGTSPIKQPAGKFTDREQIREDQRKPQTTARATSPFPSQKSDNSRVSSAKRSRADEPIFYTTVGGKASGSVSPKPTSERGKFTSPAVQIRNSDYHQQARSSVKVSATSSKKLTEDKRSSPIPMRAGAELEVE